MSFFNSTTAKSQPIIADAVRAVERQQYAGQFILPFTAKNKLTGKHPIISATQFDNDLSAPRARGAAAKRVDYEYTQGTFECLSYALEAGISDEELDEAEDDGLDDLVTMRANLTADAMLLGHDIRVASLLAGAGFNSTAATAVFSSASTAKPIQNIKAARQRLNDKGFFTGLNLIIESSLYTEMEETDDFRSLINGSGMTMLEKSRVAQLLGIDNIIITSSAKNAAAKGQAASRSTVWSTSKIYLVQIAGGDFSNGGIGRTVIDERNGPAPFGVFTYRDESLEENIIKVKNRVDEIIINAQAGEEITGC